MRRLIIASILIALLVGWTGTATGTPDDSPIATPTPTDPFISPIATPTQTDPFISPIGTPGPTAIELREFRAH